MLPSNVLYYGKDEPLPQQMPLRAGALTLILEGGDLRYIRLGKHEIVRHIYVALRDREWNTILPRITDLQMEVERDSFRILYDVEHVQGEFNFAWRATIIGGADSTITFTMDGEARSTFWRNRLGFCVLYSHDHAGARARIEHVDGRTEESTFPTLVAPQFIVDDTIKPVDPFDELRALTHEFAPDQWATVSFEGETFEMEDQRNWTDASYKVYGTPLRIPFPVEVRAGTQLAQTIRIALLNPPDVKAEPLDEQPVDIHIAEASAYALPQIGLSIASHGEPLTTREADHLRALRLSHLRTELNLTEPGLETRLQTAIEQAAALDTALELALIVSDDAERELADLGRLLETHRPRLSSILVFHQGEQVTSERWLRIARERLSSAAPLGGGTRSHFADLNRTRPFTQAALLDRVCYGLTPQMHTFDNGSIIETISAIPATVATARDVANGLPVAISPVTLKPGSGAEAVERALASGQLPPQVDVRQMSLFGAAYTLGVLKALGEAGAVSVTLYETTGWLGVIEREAGSRLPEQFPSLPGAVFPIYHILADLSDWVDADVLPVTSSDPLRVDGLALRKGDAVRILLANMTPHQEVFDIRVPGSTAQLRLLNDDNAEAAMTEPELWRAEPGERLSIFNGEVELTLPPFALARLDIS